MKKYIKPELECNELAMATIMAASDGGTTTPSATTLSPSSALPGVGVDAKRVIPSHGNKFDF